VHGAQLLFFVMTYSIAESGLSFLSILLRHFSMLYLLALDPRHWHAGVNICGHGATIISRC
jgi:hypothetical protein